MSAGDLSKIIPVLLERIESDYRKQRLYVSTDANGCLRRTCLELAGAEKRKPGAQELSFRKQGDLIHEWLGRELQRNGFALVEYSVNPGLDLLTGTEGRWSGRVDFLLFLRENQTYRLWDLKTVNAKRLFWDDFYTARGEASRVPSEDERWQLSVYFWALREMGFEVERADICYFARDRFETRIGKEKVETDFVARSVQIEPIPREEVKARLAEVDRAVSIWEAAFRQTENAENEHLPEPLEPEQKLVPKPSARNPKHYELHTVTNWRCEFCPLFEVSCRPEKGRGRVGRFEFDHASGEWIYEADPGCGHIKPVLRPGEVF